MSLVRVYYCGEQVRGYTIPDSDEELADHPEKIINEIDHHYIDMPRTELDQFMEPTGHVNIFKLHAHLMSKK